MGRVAKQESHLHGLLIIDKPGRSAQHHGSVASTERLPTSHDVVQRVRRWSQQRRVGHTGTLDPLASGVLVLCLGRATRLVEYYQGHAKQYYAEIALGAATDTYDALGQVTQQSAVPELDQDRIESVLQQFRGEILQMPPIYSAIKQGGESVHRKARRGEAVTLTQRPVNFHQLDFINYTSTESRDNIEGMGARLMVRATCSAGGYIRSLAHDLGLALGTHGYLDVLRREKAGPFSLVESHTFDEIEAASQRDELADLLLPLGYGLEMPKLEVDADFARRLGHGQRVPMPQNMAWLSTQGAKLGEPLVQAIDNSGNTLGILRCLHDISEKAAVQSPEIAEGDSPFRQVQPTCGHESLPEKAETTPTDPDFMAQGAVWKAEKWFQ